MEISRQAQCRLDVVVLKGGGHPSMIAPNLKSTIAPKLKALVAHFNNAVNLKARKEEMNTNQTQANWQKTALRLPRDLHQQVHEVAKAEDRTFNGQIVALIREGIQSRTKPAIVNGVANT